MRSLRILFVLSVLVLPLSIFAQERANLPVGVPLPSVTVYDAQGQAFNLSELKGSYSVLVSGCLT
jgi:cytochrome oxidase Cu insertion factor (SCO1/SenC/PrrC family)